MTRTGWCLLLLVATARAGREDDMAGFTAMQEYHRTLAGSGGSIESVRSLCVAHLKGMSPKVRASVVRQLNRGFGKKYGKGDSYHRALCEALAAGGKNGIATLYRRYKTERKRSQIRLMATESLAACNDRIALDTLVKIMYDKDPAVATAAVKGIGNYPQASERKRKDIVKKMVTHYSKVTDGAAGKGAETVQMKTYRALKPAMNETLKAFTGQQLDSAAAWKAWFSENISKPWSS